MDRTSHKPIAYHLKPTKLIPNSDFPLLHYPAFFADDELSAIKVDAVFASNGWETQWMARYAKTQTSHYHSKTHEAMVVLNGSARIRFGAADLPTKPGAPKLGDSDHANDEGREEGGRELDTSAGDVWIIPAGVSHKTFNAQPEMPFKFLSGGDGHFVPSDVDLDKIEISGFIMLGAYPKGFSWDFCCGGEGKEDVEKPQKDPVLGSDSNGLLGAW